MKYLLAGLVLAALSLAPSFGGSAAAEGPGDDSLTGEDLGVQLVDMFTRIADVLAARQDQIANESHIGSAASGRRLRSAILRAPDVSVRGASPFFEGWVIGDD